MSTMPNPNNPSPMPPRPQMGGPSGAAVATIDPIKLVMKYKWVLGGALAVGIVIGVGLHLVLLRVAPVFKPKVIFECTMAPTTLTTSVANQIVPKDDYERFLMTEVARMKSDTVLRKVAEDQRLKADAATWAGRFLEGDGAEQKVNSRKALKELNESISVRMIPETRFITLEVSYKVPADATTLVRFIKDSYLIEQQRVSRSGTTKQVEVLNKQISDLDTEAAQLTRQRESLISGSSVDSLDDRASSLRETLSLISHELVDVENKFKGVSELLAIYEEQLKSPAGVTYTDSVRASAEADPELQELKRNISGLEANLESLKVRGVSEEHREWKATFAALEGYKGQDKSTRERLLRNKFDSEVDNIRTTTRQFQAQRDALNTRKDELRTQLVDLARVQGQLKDIDLKVTGAQTSRRALMEQVKSAQAIADLDFSNRVTVAQVERIPEEVAFPSIKVMVPLGVMLTLGLVGGIIVASEILDQRVKGPADIALIPRTRVLGFVPDALEDPAGSGAIETVMRDRPKGVLAESFRNIRGVLSKRLNQTGHRTVLVVAGMPGSGSTSVVSNLALAAGSAGQRVLVIDANMRRPGLHRVFGLADQPGLVDVLTGSARFDQAIQRTTDGKISVLSVGSKEKRTLEMLSTNGMTDLLAEARSKFDLVLIDCAPAIVSGDCLTLAAKCDASVLVVKALSEKRGLIARLRNDLSDTRAEFMGVVVNGVKSAAGGYLKSNIKASADYQSAA